MSIFSRSSSKTGSGPDGDPLAITPESIVIELLRSIETKLETLLDYQAVIADDDNPPTRDTDL